MDEAPADRSRPENGLGGGVAPEPLNGKPAGLESPVALAHRIAKERGVPMDRVLGEYHDEDLRTSACDECGKPSGLRTHRMNCPVPALVEAAIRERKLRIPRGL